MSKSHIYNSGRRVLKALEYLHNLPETPLGESRVKVQPTKLAEYLTKKCAEGDEEISRDTAKDILNAIIDSNTGYILEWTKSKGGQDQYWFRRPFTLEQLSLLSTIISSSMFLNEAQIEELLKRLNTLTSEENAAKLSSSDHFFRPRMMNGHALDNLRKIHEAINKECTLRFYVGKLNFKKHIYYDKPIRGKANEFVRITLQDEHGADPQNSTLPKSSKEDAAPIICYPYSLVWDNSRCYLICGVEEDNRINIMNYRVDRLFELKILENVKRRAPRSSPYYDPKSDTINVERYLNSTFKMFTNNNPLWYNITIACSRYHGWIYKLRLFLL